MLSTDQSIKFAYGSVWLVSAADADPRHLSPLAVHALHSADAVIHDPGMPKEILDLVKPPQYREIAPPMRAIERSIKLAEDGWRVVQLVKDHALDRAVEGAMRCAERNVPFRIVPNVGEPIGDERPLGFIVLRKALSVGGPDPRSAIVLLVATPYSDATTGGVQRQRPLDFSMSGLAG
jgi:uroporphyrin-III C-methyltransferase